MSTTGDTTHAPGPGIRAEPTLHTGNSSHREVRCGIAIAPLSINRTRGEVSTNLGYF
ncbi:MAG TPA: hypothetical protein VER11_35080 [Polyangiaceae bacterium]|nr:hypothetical protein [Polyangiaceae bacterium]